MYWNFINFDSTSESDPATENALSTFKIYFIKIFILYYFF